MKYLNNQNRTDITIILILAGLSFCLCFALSSPSLFMNDEWITTNQLNQLFSGTQLLENEGKYGRLFTGEMGAYFTTRDNYLAYSLMLPVLSVPALYIIVTTGDLFRLLFLLGWFVIGTCSLLACVNICSQFSHKKTEYFFLLILGAFLGLLLVNLYYYQPFESSWDDSPIESAAIIITNNVLFAFIAPMLFAIFRSVRLSRSIALVGSLTVLSCSSYLYWAGSAKDHLLIAFLISLLLFIFSMNYSKFSSLRTFCLFFVGGLLCWARPEYGIIIFIGLILCEIVALYHLKDNIISHQLIIVRIKEAGVSITGAIVGLIPFFINNILITKNPFVPPQYLYIINSRVQAPSIIQSIDPGQSGTLSPIFIYFNQVIQFFSPDIQNIFFDLYRLFVISPNGSIGILLICPIFLPALIYGLKTREHFKRMHNAEMRKLLLFCIFLITITFIAYARVIYGSTQSIGSLPDMRYFSPIYLPMGILSILLLSPIMRVNSFRWLNYSVLAIFVIGPLLILSYLGILTQGFSIATHISLMLKLFLIVYLLLIGYAAFNPQLWYSKKIFPSLYALLLTIPSSIQFMLILFYSHIKMNGYPFWQPVLEYLFTHVLQIID